MFMKDALKKKMIKEVSKRKDFAQFCVENFGFDEAFKRAEQLEALVNMLKAHEGEIATYGYPKWKDRDFVEIYSGVIDRDYVTISENKVVIMASEPILQTFSDLEQWNNKEGDRIAEISADAFAELTINPSDSNPNNYELYIGNDMATKYVNKKIMGAGNKAVNGIAHRFGLIGNDNVVASINSGARKKISDFKEVYKQILK